MTAKEWKKIFNSKEFEENYTYTGNDLGAFYEKDKTTFKVWAPTADRVCFIYSLQEAGKKREKRNFSKWKWKRENREFM